jgi:hypothetical protein
MFLTTFRTWQDKSVTGCENRLIRKISKNKNGFLLEKSRFM